MSCISRFMCCVTSDRDTLNRSCLHKQRSDDSTSFPPPKNQRKFLQIHFIDLPFARVSRDPIFSLVFTSVLFTDEGISFPSHLKIDFFCLFKCLLMHVIICLYRVWDDASIINARHAHLCMFVLQGYSYIRLSH